MFTDIEGSTRLWEEHPNAMRAALARHDELLRQAIEGNSGVVFKTVGDAFCAAFATASDALAAAVASHLLLRNEEWGETGVLRVRIGLHTGEAEERGGDYFGQTLNRVARLQAVGHGQQTLLSQNTYQLVCHSLPTDVTLQDMGRHRLKDLLAPEHVWQLLHPALPTAFPPLKSLDYLPTNLPRQMTSFIGREREMREVKRLLPSTPLLTLVGSGGAGKTRLAVQVGAEALDEYKDGVWLVELAALSDPDLLPQAVASVLGLREEPGRPLLQTIQDYLRDRQLLLLLDNCEHLVGACALLADTLLKTCPRLSILASSREPLGIAGEHPWRVPSLLTPAPNELPGEEKDLAAVLMEYDACRLFVERAVVQRQDFVLTRRNVPVVAHLCRQLDGIPLAIELAAARVRSLSVEEINARLDNRFRLLTGGSKAALPRQQTLRALIDWSYDLLNVQEKTLLCRLSVFAGGWTLGAAEQVGIGENGGGESIEEWEVLDLMTSLVDKSLVPAQVHGESTRYHLLETVRQYARERLDATGEGESVQARHGDYFLMIAEEACRKLVGSEQAHWLEVLEEEHDNVRQALTLYERDTEAGEKGLRLGVALQQFWWTRGHLSEGRERLAALLAHPGGQESTRARADALNGAGMLAYKQGDYTQAQVLHDESLAISRELKDKAGIASSFNNLGLVAWCQGDYAQARSRCEESLALFREAGDKTGLANSLGNLGLVVNNQGDPTLARALHEESLELWRALGYKGGIALALGNLGLVAAEQADYARAQVLLEESLSLRRELGEKVGIAQTLNNLGNVAYDRGDYARAYVLLEESLFLRRELRDKAGIASSLGNLGNVAYEKGDYAQVRVLYGESLRTARALGDKRVMAYGLEAFALLSLKETQEERGIRLWGAAAMLRETIGSPLPPADREKQEHEAAAVREVLGEDAFALAWTEGRAMTMEQAIEYAMADVTV
ncbi:MAG: adenylate/guanylate cyclase protein [Chthonomonadaceae bacterium]|nr:adenylate/guanylate cyclase protein [Chthonomonadaceae bacterium]